MKRLYQYLTQTLSVRLSLMVALTSVLLLMAALFIMLHYVLQVVRDEDMQRAEYTLKSTVKNIDNILLSVEQSAGNIYWDVLLHLDEPNRMFDYCRHLLQANPYVSGCAIAMQPYYYPARGKYFMAYVYRSRNDDDSGELAMDDSPIIQSATFGNKPYNEQVWYVRPMELGRPYWTDPLEDTQPDGESIVTYSLPLYNRRGEKVGVLGVDIALSLLSDIILATKLSPHSFCTMLSRKGSFIVHPSDSVIRQRLHVNTVLEQLNISSGQTRQIVGNMLAGKRGSGEFAKHDTTWYAFYEPFERTIVPGRVNDTLGWSVSVMYPEDDILGEYQQLKYYVVGIALLAMLLLLVLCVTYAHRYLLPLRMLTHSAQRIARGQYDGIIAESSRKDEIGQLQNHFRNMQQALGVHVSELERLRTSLQQQGDHLEDAYRQTQDADRMKTAVLHKMTRRMTVPAEALLHDVETLQQWDAMSQEHTEQVVHDIGRQTQAITDLLDDLLAKEQNNTTGP